MKSTESSRPNRARWLRALVLLPLLAARPAPAQERNPIGNGGPLVFGAARNGNADSVREQIALNPQLITVRNESGQTLLHVAAARRDAALVALLLEAGADANARDNEGRTPLHLALPDGWRRTGENGPVEPIVQLLVDKKADVNARDNEGRTPLYLAGAGPASKILRASGAIDLLESWFVAVKNSDKAKLETLLATDATLLGGADREGLTALHRAVRWRDATLVEWLLSKSAPIDALDAKKRTPLLLAIASRQTRMAETLLAKGANVNGVAPKTGPDAAPNSAPIPAITPLVQALESGSSEMVTILVARGADLSSQRYFSRVSSSLPLGEMALLEAAKAGDLALAKTLLDKGVAPKARALLRMPLLTGDAEMVKLLVARGAPLNGELNERPDEDHQGAETPLHWAASRRGNAPLVSLLLDNGAKWTGLDFQRRTPLNVAVATGDRDIVLALAAKKAVAAPPDADQYPKIETPLQVALRGFDRAMVLLLIQNGAKHPDALIQAIVQGDAEGAKTLPLPEPPERAPRPAPRSPLHLAAWLGQPEVVTALLNRGLDVNALSDVTPLQLAVLSGNAPTVKILLDKGADVNARTAAGRTALHFAAMSAPAEIVALLLAKGAERDAVSGQAGSGTEETPLSTAARYGNGAALEILLDAGSDPNATVGYGTTPLMLAAQSRDAASIAILLAKGAAMDARDNLGFTVWHHAARGVSHNFMEPVWGQSTPRPPFVADARLAFAALKAANAPAEAGPAAPSRPKTGAGGEIPAALLADRDDVAALLWMLDNGIAVDARDGKGSTLLQRAVASGSENVVKLLLARKADVNALDGTGRTALDVAQRRGEISADYVDFPFIPNSYSVPQNFDELGGDGSSRPPLLRPDLGRLATVLQAAGAKVGGGPFLRAVNSGAVAVVRDLLAQNPALALTVMGKNNNDELINLDIGLAPNALGAWPISALQRAVEAQSPPIVQALVTAGALAGPPGSDTPALTWAVGRESPEIVKILLDGGAKIDELDSQGETALFMAARFNNVSMVKLLLDRGADVKITNKKGETVLSQLPKGPQTQDIRALLEARNAP